MTLPTVSTKKLRAMSDQKSAPQRVTPMSTTAPALLLLPAPNDPTQREKGRTEERAGRIDRSIEVDRGVDRWMDR